MRTHDVVVIGGSLAGAACVRELERKGIDAVALERDHFPRRKVCGGFLSSGAVECIRRLGLLDDVLRAGAVEVTSTCVRINGFETRIPFERPGLGISRTALDEIVARGARIEQGWDVREIRRVDAGFIVDGIRCLAVIDASGKLGRFTKRQTVDEFGVQYTESQARGSVLDFWFFDDGYGGAVSVETGSNFCFLIQKRALRRYIDRSDCMVTGPLAYERVPGEFIAIGDAAGMVDPFCGEGMRHAFETGTLAGRVVASGIRRGVSYAEMKWQYQSERDRHWLIRRTAGAAMRRMRPHFGLALRVTPAWLLNRIWD
jgi:flavin-dependent dehydrogenase